MNTEILGVITMYVVMVLTRHSSGQVYWKDI